MGFFNAFKKVAGAAANEVKAASNENKDVLEAYVAAAALMATADGTVDDSEKQKTTRLLSSSKDLKGVFTTEVIEKTFDDYCKLAMTSVGRQQLVEEFDDLKRLPDSQKLREHIYLFAKDVCMADGTMDETEQKRLNVVAQMLEVDTKKFLMDF